MGTMKLFLKLISMILITLFLSCSNRKDFIFSLDVGPNIKIKELNNTFKIYQDSIKVDSGLKGFAAINLIFSGPDGISSFTYSKANNNGVLEYKNDTIKGSSLNSSNGEITLKYIPSFFGTQELHFKVQDRFQGADSCIYKVLSFKNLPPVAFCNVTPIRLVDPLEYEIDGSKSYDEDVNYGGGVVQYIFFINGQEIKTTKAFIKYIFPKPGQYTINLQVVDNDGAISNISTINQLID